MTQKIRIRIKRPLGEIVVTRKVRSDGKSAILWKENERKNRPEWMVKFGKNGCVYRTKKTFLGGKQDTIDVYPWSEEAVVHDYENEEDEEPLYDRETEYRQTHADVVKSLGEPEEEKRDAITWVLLFLMVGTFLISLLQYWKGAVG
jgi:hypothetical protein